MQHVSGTLKDNNWQLAIGKNNLITIGNCKSIKLSRDEVVKCDLALKDYQDLFIQEYKGWICNVFYSVGEERFVILAKEARAGRLPKRLFTYLLKKELAKYSDPSA